VRIREERRGWVTVRLVSLAGAIKVRRTCLQFGAARRPHTAPPLGRGFGSPRGAAPQFITLWVDAGPFNLRGDIESEGKSLSALQPY
jgi:hypothetical protein